MGVGRSKRPLGPERLHIAVVEKGSSGQLLVCKHVHQASAVSGMQCMLRGAIYSFFVTEVCELSTLHKLYRTSREQRWYPVTQSQGDLLFGLSSFEFERFTIHSKENLFKLHLAP